MQSIERHRKIIELLKAKKIISVEELASKFKTTPQTIRADLRDLDTR